MVAYKVLARTHRPSSFEDSFIGQEATVKILSKAIELKHLPHAILFSGIRGIGKTTTARIVARTINCKNLSFVDGIPKPCGKCDPCQAIEGENCLDVIELDAASHTGVDDIRTVIDSFPFKPTLCNYKVYIIDEVHMLSKSAFNALLKNLEEPPEHVKVIFATTEPHKVPATILSRCMRFDLRPFTKEELKKHLKNVALKESIQLDPLALDLLAEAAKGSARDALSLLDQAQHLNKDTISPDQVRSMLGKADLSDIFSLMDKLLAGNVEPALSLLEDIVEKGSAPEEIAESLLSILHAATKMRAAPTMALSSFYNQKEENYLKKLSSSLSMPVLQSLWQVVSKGYDDINKSPLPEVALEMIILRLLHVKTTVERSLVFAPSSHKIGEPSAKISGDADASFQVPSDNDFSSSDAKKKDDDHPPHQIEAIPAPTTFEDLVTLFQKKREALIASHLSQDVHLVSYTPSTASTTGVLELKPTDHAPPTLCKAVRTLLEKWTACEWIVKSTTSSQQPEKTLEQQRLDTKAALEKEAQNDPLVTEALAAFPGSKITKIETVRHADTSATIKDKQ